MRQQHQSNSPMMCSLQICTGSLNQLEGEGQARKGPTCLCSLLLMVYFYYIHVSAITNCMWIDNTFHVQNYFVAIFPMIHNRSLFHFPSYSVFSVFMYILYSIALQSHNIVRLLIIICLTCCYDLCRKVPFDQQIRKSGKEH